MVNFTINIVCKEYNLKFMMPNEKKRRKLNDENEINNFENLEEIALVHPSPLSLAPQNSARRFTPGNPSICKLILIFHFVNLLIC